MADFPNRINELRRARGLSQEALAKSTGTHKVQISALERGKRPLTLDWMRRIAKQLGVAPADLLNLDDNPGRLALDEAELLESYRRADPVTRENLIRVAESLADFRGNPRDAA